MFIARGPDALDDGCCHDARFLLVATLSGLTPAPEALWHDTLIPPAGEADQPR
jgi:pyruvate dehydrogenase complex dehydrogenase (E1) component